MAFTTWSALLTELQDDLASGGWKRKEYTVGDRSTTFHSLRELTEFIDYVETKAAAETGSYAGRTSMVNGGRG